MRFILAGILVTTFLGIAQAAEITANRTLRVGAVISAVDFTVTGDRAEEIAAAIVGMEVRRAVYVGHRINGADLGPPTLVRRNEVVIMSYQSGGLSLRAEGRALTAGGEGELVDVMNLASRQTVRAIVSGRRAVEVRR